MGRISRWHDVPGHFQPHVSIDDRLGGWVDDDGRELPPSLAAWLSEKYPTESHMGFGVPLMIEFTSSGYSDPGGWDDPPDSDDEREIDRVFVDDTPPTVLPESLHGVVMAHWEKDIREVVVDKTPDYGMEIA